MSHDYDSLKLAFMSVDLSLLQMCELRELLDAEIAHEQEKICLFTFEGVERPELLRQFRQLRRVLESEGVRVPENPKSNTYEGLKWSLYRLGLPPRTLFLSVDGTWDILGHKMLAAEMPESNLANLLGSHGIDVSDWKFVN
jgi:hypothetical protein